MRCGVAVERRRNAKGKRHRATPRSEQHPS